MSHMLLFIHLDMPSKISHDQMVMQGEALVFFIVTCSKCAKCLIVKNVYFEYSEWCVSWHNHCIRLCIVYHQPYSVSHPVTDATFIQDFESYLNTLVLADEMLCITGDFNLHIDDPTDTYGCQFNDLLSSFGLINHITFPTHQSGHTLDLVITQNNQEIELRSIKPGYFLSDHCFVCVEIIAAQPDVQRRKLSYCKFKSIE